MESGQDCQGNKWIGIIGDPWEEEAPKWTGFCSDVEAFLFRLWRWTSQKTLERI